MNIKGVPMFSSAAYAQDAAAGAPDLFGSFIPLILIFVIFWFLIIRPQSKRMKEHREMVAGVRRGDVVVTSGGIVGKVTKVLDDSDEITVEIADGIKVQVVKSTLTDVRSRTEPAND